MDSERPREIDRACKTHGLTRFILEGRGYYRCKRCRGEHVAAWRRRTKLRLIKEAGARCILCGYDRCPRALHFHHVDPSTKEFGIARYGVTRSIARARAEIAKCVLLCSNCHMEVEAGIVEVPQG
jgi:hypothetical protein